MAKALHLERKWLARPTLQGWPLDKKIRAWGVCWLALNTPIVPRQAYASLCTSLQTHCPSLFLPYSWARVFFFPGFVELIHSFLWYFVCVCYFLFAATGFPVLPRARWCQSFPSPQVLFRILMNCIYVHIHSIYFKFPVKRCVCRKRRTTAAAACWFSFSCLIVVFDRVAFFSLPALLFPCVQRLIAIHS